MTHLLLGLTLITLAYNSPPLHQTGTVKYYAPGVMQRVYAQRLEWRHVEPCIECVGLIALMRPEHVGQRVYLARAGQPFEGPFLVVDCAGSDVLARRLRQGDVAEVSWEIAKRWNMRGPLADVRVLFAPRRSARPTEDTNPKQEFYHD